MKKMILPAVVALAVSASSAFAADLDKKMVTKAPAPEPAPAWDIAVGGLVGTDYIFRGITQSNHGPTAGAYFEPQFTTPIGTFYVGLAGWSIDWPSEPSFGLTSPSAEIDFYGGWRNSWGPFSIDLGALYYYYPKEIYNGYTSNSDFYEIYAKLAYAITPDLTVGANVFWTPDMLNYSDTFASVAYGAYSADASATYVSGTLKWVTPFSANGVGLYVSGEVGHWFIDDTGFVLGGYGDPSYTYWNVGAAFTYKAITLDLRYHDTDLGTTGCGNYLLVGTPHATNDWCDGTFVATLKFDTSLNALK